MLRILCRKKKATQTNKPNLPYEKGSELDLQIILIFKKINKKDPFISETGAQGLTMWGGVRGGS